MLPPEITLAVLDDEYPPAEVWGGKHGWVLSLDRDALIVDAATAHPVDGGPLLLIAGVDGYRELPPSWRFVDSESREVTPTSTPSREGSSVIHSPGVICAHFSRTAYKGYDQAAPHDWELASWDAPQEGVQAHTLAEMLSVIDRHLKCSTGRFT